MEVVRFFEGSFIGSGSIVLNNLKIKSIHLLKWAQ